MFHYWADGDYPANGIAPERNEADRSGAWTTSSLQEDMARVLVREYAGDLEEARELADGAVARSRASGSTYWLAGFLAQIGLVETSDRNWHAALKALREVAQIFAHTGMVDLEQLLWGSTAPTPPCRLAPSMTLRWLSPYCGARAPRAGRRR